MRGPFRSWTRCLCKLGCAALYYTSISIAKLILSKTTVYIKPDMNNTNTISSRVIEEDPWVRFILICKPEQSGKTFVMIQQLIKDLNNSDKIVINEIIIDRPEFMLETGLGLQKSNIGTMLENIQAFVGTSDEKEEESASSKSVQIDLLRITGGKVKLSNKLLGGQSLMIPLPNIELTDIGAEGGGVSFGESSKIVFQAINQGIVSSVGQSGKVVSDQLKNVGDATKKGLGGLFKGLKDAVDGEKE